MGNNSWMDFFFLRQLVPQSVENIICVCYFLNIGLGSKTNQCSPHFSKQSLPGLPYLEPHRQVNATTLELRATNFKNFTKKTNLFSNLDFLPKYGFPKTRDLSPAASRGVYISRIDPKKKNPIVLANHQKSSFFDKMASFFFGPSWPGSLGQALDKLDLWAPYCN